MQGQERGCVDDLGLCDTWGYKEPCMTDSPFDKLKKSVSPSLASSDERCCLEVRLKM